MATIFVRVSPRILVIQCKNGLQSSAKYSRAFSSSGRRIPERDNETAAKIKADSPSNTKWLNIVSGIFGPNDSRLPLPGEVGMSHNLCPIIIQPFIGNNIVANTQTTSLDRQSWVLEQHAANSYSKQGSVTEDNVLECKIQDCPDLLKKEFSCLFPQQNLKDQNLTILTLSQKTMNDMSSWSLEVEAEREELFKHFNEVASTICEVLTSDGYWADFIDPSSGKPFYGPNTNSSLFETDPRYRHFGFVIDDLGCCKVITHKKWGCNVFVGVRSRVHSRRSVAPLVALYAAFVIGGGVEKSLLEV